MNRVQSLEVPSEVKELELPDNEKLRMHLEKCLGGLDMPSVVLGIGNRIDTGTEFFSLWFLSGMNPEKALEEIKKRLI